MSFPTSRSRSAHRNPIPGKCWGCLTRCLGYCDKDARPGKLTCWHHQTAEQAAQKLWGGLRVITNDDDLDRAFAWVDYLIRLPESVATNKKLDELSAAIEKYEDTHYPM